MLVDTGYILKCSFSSHDLMCHFIAGDAHLNSTHKLNGSTVNPYNVDSLKDVTKRSLKPLKRYETHRST